MPFAKNNKTPAGFYEEKIRNGELLIDPSQEAGMAALQRLYDELMAARPRRKTVFSASSVSPQGVYLHGGVGRGKTMLMDMFFGALPETVAKRRVHFHEFMIGVHDFMHKARLAARTDKDRESALLKYAQDLAQSARVLCFDEFHVTDVADAMILDRLFRALFHRGVTVVATSNWPPDKLYEGGLQRDRFLPFIALVKERMQIIEMAGPVDYRLQCLSDTGVYFWPLGEEARNHANEVFALLTDGAPVRTQTIEVKGRKVAVDSAARGVARFSFSQLCERPVGAEDFLAIAGAFHTVFLEGMPTMGYDRRNEAKRLMILVDTLYDRRVRLVVTADAPPDGLYRGHDHEFEFQRTVSRLIEMQGEAYLSAGRKI